MRKVEHKATFNEAAELYAEVRPGYPDAVIEAIIERSGLPQGGRILEVGTGTGQATLPFAERGFEVLGLELGDALAGVAAEKLRAYPKVKILNIAFEDWRPEPASFDLFLSAQAFHWIEPTFGLDRAAEMLKPSGSLALMWYLDRSQQSAFYKTTDPIYKRYFTGESDKPSKRSLPEWVEVYQTALDEHPQFEAPAELRLDWEETYSKDAYLKLLNTFSDHRRLEEPAKTQFFDEIAGVVDAFGGSVTRLYTTVLLLAKRRAEATLSHPLS